MIQKNFIYNYNIMSNKDKKVKNIDYSYPETDDKDIVSKIYKKREFQYHRIPKRKIMETYDEVQKYREQVCKPDYKPRQQQAILTNLHTDFDYSYLKRKLPSNIIPAYDGLSFTF